MDQPEYAHNPQHKNITEYRNCPTSTETSYVDDLFSIVKSQPNTNLWVTIENFIVNMNRYYTNNKMKNNITKTKVMIISKENNLKKETITIEQEKIKPRNSLKTLGVIIDDKLKFEEHISNSKEALIKQINKRI